MIPIRWNWRKNYILYFMLLPAFVFVLVFNYIPMYGLIIAFQDFKPVHSFIGSPFVGLKWFRIVVDSPDFSQILFNTLIISALKIFFGTLITIMFALLLNEVRHTLYKRSIQTFVYFPHFLSWVIVGGIFIDFLSTKGPVNQFLNMIGIQDIFFLGDNDWFRFTLVSSDVWKGFGWGVILYLAALSGINPELYEAAIMDGASRWRQTWHITIPGIMPTTVLLTTLNIGVILNAGFGLEGTGYEQVLMLYNPAVYESGDIIDTFVYRVGLLDSQYSLATAVGLGKSFVGILLIVISYRLAYKLTNYRIF